MNKSILLFLCCLFGLYNAHSQNYQIRSIPDSLTKKANAVYLIKDGVHEIIDEEKAVFRYHEVVAILNKKANKYASTVVFYDSNTEIKKFEGKVYDANGKLIEKSKKSDIYDRSAISDFSIYEDDRLQFLDLEQIHYPYFVEFEYEIEYNQTYGVRDWYTSNSSASVVSTNYEIISPLSMEPNFKIMFSDQKFNRTVIDNRVSNKISFANLKAAKGESYSKYNINHPRVIVSPSSFSYAGYKGSLNSWKEFGLWIFELNKGRDDISEESKMEILELTKDLDSNKEKIKAVYQYVQNKTRYVSVQLGIGGLQTFPASYVEKNGYGDCKALSNYTATLLNAIGIEAYNALVEAGDDFDSLSADFSYAPFNHVIVCAPNQGDTVWLECTSQSNPFNYQGTFTGGRQALLITENGGVLANTHAYKASDNLRSSQSKFEITENGQGNGSIKISYSGLQHERKGLSFIIDDGEEKVKKWLYNNLGLSSFQIENISYSYLKNEIPSIEFEIDVTANSVASTSGQRIFLEPNLYNRWNYVPSSDHNRQTDIEISDSYALVDTIHISLPDHYYIESIPQDVDMSFGLLNYQSNYQVEEQGEIKYIRSFSIKEGNMPKEDYDELREFFKQVKKSDKQKIILSSKS